MPYNEEYYGTNVKALTKSMYSQDYVDTIHPTPPENFFLVDADGTYIVDGTDDFIVGVT